TCGAGEASRSTCSLCSLSSSLAALGLRSRLMALTMTRTRTQTTLTRLAQATAEVHAELALIEALTLLLPASCLQLVARRQHLLLERDALYLTLRQFDEEIDGQVIGQSWRWLRRGGCRT